MSTGRPRFRRRERDGVVTYSGRDHLTAMGWWLIVALLGGGVAFLALDPLGPVITGGFAVGAIVLGFLGQLTGRFRLRLETQGPSLTYSLLGLPYRRRLLPNTVRARVMGLEDHGGAGKDGKNAAVELFLERAGLDGLFIGEREAAEPLCEVLGADLRSRYGDADEALERMEANRPWLIRGLGWLQSATGMLRPSVVRDGGTLRVELPLDGVDANPGETTLWLVVGAGASVGLAVTRGLGLALGSWVAGVLLVLAVGVVAWRFGRSALIEIGPEGGWIVRRRFGFSTWRLPVDPRGWSLRHAWWCGHPSGIAFRGREGDDELALDRIKFGPVSCASAWAWLSPLEELLGSGGPERTPEADHDGRKRKRRRRRKR